VSNTTVIGKADTVTFKTTGKEILEKGWKVVFENSEATDKKEKGILPTFVKGEKGPHEPSFLEKETKAPNQYTEATLLRAMETAGKQVDDDEMRELMKENGIGRPSTRANIIETLFRRKYIERKKKQVLPTTIGVQLIDTIQNKLLTSAELTGRWEKQLKEIEKGNFHAGAFIKNMKHMVDHLVYEVRMEQKRANISHVTVMNSTAPKKDIKKQHINGQSCPKCKQGTLLKGKTAYGCSAYKTGCNLVLPFSFKGKKISEKQYIRLLQKGCTVNLKGFKTTEGIKEGLVRFDERFQLHFEEKKVLEITSSKKASEEIPCPKCAKGTIVKGKTAYGCSGYKSGCDFRYSFEVIREKAQGEPLTASLVLSIFFNKYNLSL